MSTYTRVVMRTTAVGLQLNAAKSKIFTTKPLDHPIYAEVSQDLVHVLHAEASSGSILADTSLGT